MFKKNIKKKEKKCYESNATFKSNCVEHITILPVYNSCIVLGN